MSATPEHDAETLHKAMDGLGTDEKSIISLIVGRSNAFRQRIKSAYRAKYNKDLAEDLKSELSGDFEDTLIALLETPIDYDVLQLRSAVSGAGTDEDALIEIVSTRPSWVLQKLQQRYKSKYNTELIEDIKADTSGDLQGLLLSLLQNVRSSNTTPDKATCVAKAQAIHSAEEGSWKANDSTFNEILRTCSPMELAVISREYHRIAGNTIMERISKEFTSNTKEVIETILFAVVSPSEYFATRINKAIKGAGTDDKTLIRVLVSRSELDLRYIKQFYKKKFNTEMIEDIKGDCSGDYRDLLVELVSRA